jgi:NitT/TauT family transport system ATP-binding protein
VNPRIIKIDEVSAEFWNNGDFLLVLQSFGLEVPEGQFVSIIGPSGCGKTTLLRLVAGLLCPKVGSVKVAEMPAKEAMKLRTTSCVFQSPVLFPWRTVMSNILLPFEICNDKNSINNRREDWISQAKHMISLVGLQGFENSYPHQLSGGMQSRVAIARSLMSSPKILLMDEPFGNLDELTRTRMNMELLKLVGEMKSTVLFVTHSVNEAILLSDRVVVMSSRPGRIAKDIKIELIRPRTIDMIETEDFGKYAQILRRSFGMI